MNFKEFIETNNIDYGSSRFAAYYLDRVAEFEVVHSELADYYEGYVSTEYVIKFNNKFYSLTAGTNSWSEESDGLSDIEVVEVRPEEKTITVYVPV